MIEALRINLMNEKDATVPTRNAVWYSASKNPNYLSNLSRPLFDSWNILAVTGGCSHVLSPAL